MTKRRVRTPTEILEWEQQQKMLTEDVEFFDYYDTVEIFPLVDQEVDRDGQSLQTRVHLQPGLTDSTYVYTRVPPGSYMIQLSFNGRILNNTSLILEDRWFDE